MIDRTNLPRHIAIIMDGNGRWAKEKGLPRYAGHRQGSKRVKEIVKVASGLGIEALTLFTFSTENWSRPKNETDFLMRYLDNFLDREIKGLIKNNIKFLVIGEGDPLPGYLQKKIKKVEDLTKDNTGLKLVLALNYGSRQEIVNAAKKIAQSVINGKMRLEDLNEDKFAQHLYTRDLPDPDLLIRTSAEIRISNFLLWQLSYTELAFPKKYWPDFKEKDLLSAIEEYQKRKRRFGGVDVKE